MSMLEKRVTALESAKLSGKPAYAFVWSDDDQATQDRAIAKCRAEHPDASEIIAIAWEGSSQ